VTAEGVTLVLGAGGVVGHAWHVGVLAGLLEGMDWDARRADVVIGTSAGSMVAALLRAGIGPADLAARASDERVSAEGRRLLEAAGMTGPPPGPPGPPRPKRLRPASARMVGRAALTPWRFRPGLLLAGALPRGEVDPGYAGLVGRLFPGGWPDAPLWLCAVRLADGERAVFGKSHDAGGDVGSAVAASCAIPGYYAPVTVAGDEYVDGGAHSPTNADLATDGPGLVVVSSPMSVGRGALRPRPELVGRITHRATLQREVTGLRRRRRTVVTLQPGGEDLAVMGGGADALDAGRRKVVTRRARASTLRRLESPQLRSTLAALHQ
jgi:NTE family protein